MTFRAYLKNRLGTEQAEATQAHLDVLVSVLNRLPPVASAKINNVTLAEIEKRCVEQPFPHDIPMSSHATVLEDAVFYTKLKPSSLQKDRWLNIWLDPLFNKDPANDLYHFVRDYLTVGDHLAFDLEYDFETQANFLLLTAHAYHDHLQAKQ